MGVYDIYGKRGIQIKIGPCELHHYNIGDRVPISDGAYVAPDGVIVIYDGKFIAEFATLITKWGDDLDLERLIGDMNPVVQALSKFKDQNKEAKYTSNNIKH